MVQSAATKAKMAGRAWLSRSIGMQRDINNIAHRRTAAHILPAAVCRTSRVSVHAYPAPANRLRGSAARLDNAGAQTAMCARSASALSLIFHP